MALTFNDQMNRFLAPLKRRIFGMLSKALIESLTDSTDLQISTISLNGETHSNVERVQPYGTTSRPLQGSQAVVLFLGGDRGNPLLIACDDGRHRVKLDVDGEFAIYSKFGNKLVMKAD